jgi:outer membrane protein assembly factor BamB/dienelactone hydrolase
LLALVLSAAPSELYAQAKKPAFKVPAEVVFRRADILSEGTRMAAEVFAPRRPPSARLATIVMSHGWGGTAAALRPDAIAFAKAGYFVVAFDYRGWGASDGRLILAGAKPEKKDGKWIAEVKEVREVVDPIDQTTDIMNAIHWAAGEELCDPDRIGLWGSSFSGGHVVYVAAREPRVKALVSQVGAMDARWVLASPAMREQTHAQGAARTHGRIGYPKPGEKFGNLRGAPLLEKLAGYAPIEDVGRCKDCAMLFLIAENEELFDNKQHAILAHERAPGVKKLVTIPGIKHYGIYNEARGQAQKLAIAWFDQHLAPVRPPSPAAGKEGTSQARDTAKPGEPAPQDNWPRFRGPRADGVAADDPRLPDTWNKKDNVQWVADVAGWGISCPVVWGDRVFLTTVVSDGQQPAAKKGLYLGQGVRAPEKGVHHWLVYCFDLKTGKELWKREAHAGEPKVPRHPKSSYAAETPATDGKRLYVLFGDLGLYCYDLGGKPLWSHKIDPKKTFLDYGAAASPVVHDDQVFVLYDNEEKSYLASFDAETGRQRWRTERDEKTTWATPFIWQNGQRTEIVTCGKRKNRSYDLSGKLLWEFDGRMSNLVIPSPFAARGLLYISSGYVGDSRRPAFAVKPGASGDVSLKDGATANEFIAWFLPKAGPYNPSPIVFGGHYYTLFDFGFLTCHDAQTGKEIYDKQRFPSGASFTASPWAYNGKLFCLSEDGTTYVVKAGGTFEVLQANPLDELCLATPAVSQGHLLIRTASKLYCISNTTPAKRGER